MFPNLNNKKFVAQCNTGNGEVSDETVFHYHQENDLVWAEYRGGTIVRGHLIGKIVDNQFLRFVYHHINLKHELLTGECTSQPAINHSGKIMLNEKWQWTCRDRSCGESTLMEL